MCLCLAVCAFGEMLGVARLVMQGYELRDQTDMLHSSL